MLEALDLYDPQNKAALLPASEKKIVIVSASSNNVHRNDIKAIELQAMLAEVQTVDETKKNVITDEINS